MSEELLSEVASGEFHKDRISRSFLIFGIGALAVALIIGLVGVVRYTSETVWNPLGSYPPQQTDKLTYKVTEPIHATARKCAKENGVKVRGSVEWVPLLSPGVLISEPGFQGVHYTSCGPDANHDHYVYTDQIPSVVGDIVRQGGPSLWRIQGTDVPYKDDGTTGEPRSWQTNTFTLVP